MYPKWIYIDPMAYTEEQVKCAVEAFLQAFRDQDPQGSVYTPGFLKTSLSLEKAQSRRK